MSSEALAWAFKQNVKPSGAKFTLVALCECANYKTGRIMPSIAHLCEITGQDRKTIIAHVAQLERDGFIQDTGERAGATKQIKVYSAGIGTVPTQEQSQERNSSVSPRKQSQKRDTEPSLEPSLPSDATHPPVRRARKPKPVEPEIILPDWLPAEPWAAFLDMRKRKDAEPSPHAIGLLIAKLERWREQGHDPGEVLNNSTENNWTGIFEPKAHHNDRPKPGNSYSGPGRPKDGVAAALDRRLGFDDASGPFGRSDAGSGQGDSGFPVARIAAMQ